MMTVSIRKATDADARAIHGLHMRTFPDSENTQVADLALNLLQGTSNPETISLVALGDTDVVGHVAFSPLKLEGLEKWSGYILGPLGISPENQRQGIGSDLVKTGFLQLREKQVDVVFVYGDPEYYGRFGFNPEYASGYRPPYELEYPFGWQAVELGDGKPLVGGGQLSCVGPLNDPTLW